MASVIDRMTVELKANVTVDKATAETCLKLVEMYVNQSHNNVICHTNEDGSVAFEFDTHLGEVKGER